MGNQSSKFQYRALANDSGKIRLLKILSHRINLCLACELHYFPQNARLPYVALSYTWGYTTNAASISLGGESVEITQNLDSFLLQARRRQKKQGSLGRLSFFT
jgi:hypothetical protein